MTTPGVMSSQLGSVPNPDPSVRTVEQLQRDIGASREIVESKLDGMKEVIQTRLNGMDKAIELLQRTTDLIPTHIKDASITLQALVHERFTSVERRTEIQFDGIAVQFAERDKRSEQLSLSDKTAVSAALQAQKESAASTNDSNAAANTKMETNFTKLIEQTQTLLQAVTRNTDDKINDIKSRLDKGEGRVSVNDPAIMAVLTTLTQEVKALQHSSSTSLGKAEGGATLWALIVGGLGLLFSLSSGIGMILHAVLR